MCIGNTFDTCDIVYEGKLEILTFPDMNNNCGTRKNIIDKEQ